MHSVRGEIGHFAQIDSHSRAVLGFEEGVEASSDFASISEEGWAPPSWGRREEPLVVTVTHVNEDAGRGVRVEGASSSDHLSAEQPNKYRRVISHSCLHFESPWVYLQWQWGRIKGSARLRCVWPLLSVPLAPSCESSDLGANVVESNSYARPLATALRVSKNIRLLDA
jgi:hypothetical protein